MKRPVPAILMTVFILVACDSAPNLPTAVQDVTEIMATSTIAEIRTPPVELTQQALQANIREATQTSAYRATQLALKPSQTLRPTTTATQTVIPTATIDRAVFQSWSVFESDPAGVRFEYPSYFAVPPFAEYGCAPTVHRADDGAVYIDIGERVWVSARAYDVATTTLNTYGESQLAEYQADPDTQVTDTGWGWVANERAFTIEYRFGGLGRYGVETYFAHRGIMYTAVFSAGVTCGMTTIEVAGVAGIDDFDAYHHMLKTWQFLDTGEP